MTKTLMESLETAFYAYTSVNSSSYDPEFTEELRRIRPDWFEMSWERTKAALLERARTGRTKPRPHAKDKAERTLAEGLGDYTKKGRTAYDAEFTAELRAIRPEWFLTVWDVLAEKKRKLLEYAETHDERPPYATPEQWVLWSCAYPTGRQYDPEFRKAVQQIRPRWLMSSKEQRMADLLELARTNPNRLAYLDEKRLATAFYNYTNPNLRFYDGEFTRQLQELAPFWFENATQLMESRLLERARIGQSRPRASVTEERKMASALTSYTTGEKFHSEFSGRIRELRPDWFGGIKTATYMPVAKVRTRDMLNRILELARSGAELPKGGTREYETIRAYTRPSYERYDPEFERQLREIRPDWFVIIDKRRWFK